MERANSQLCAGIKTSSKAHLLSAPPCALPVPSTSTTAKILSFNQSPIANTRPETSVMLRTRGIFLFGGWWVWQGVVPVRFCAEVWPATQRSQWRRIGGQKAGDKVKSARWLQFYHSDISNADVPMCVWIPGTRIWIRLPKSSGCSKPLASVLSQKARSLPRLPSTRIGNCRSGLQSLVLKKWSLERNESSVQLFHTFWLLWFSLALNLSLLSPFPLAPRGLPDLTIHPRFPCYCQPPYTWLMRNMWLFNTS